MSNNTEPYDNNKATLATLQTQVKGLEGDYAELRGAVNALDNKLESSFSSLRDQLEGALGQLTNKLEERNKTPWALIWSGAGVCVVMLGFVGSLLYTPIKETQVQLQSTAADTSHSLSELLHTLPDKYVNYREHERLIRQMDNADTILRLQMVSRVEHEQHWKALDEKDKELDRQILDVRNRLENYFNKRVDSSIWTPRDELERIERERLKSAEPR